MIANVKSSPLKVIPDDFKMPTFGKQQLAEFVSGFYAANNVKINLAALLDCIHYEDQALMIGTVMVEGPITDLVNDIKTKQFDQVGTDLFIGALFAFFTAMSAYQGLPFCENITANKDDLKAFKPFIDPRHFETTPTEIFYAGNNVLANFEEAVESIYENDFETFGKVFGGLMNMSKKELSPKPDFKDMAETLQGFANAFGLKFDFLVLLECIYQLDDEALTALSLAAMIKEAW